MILKVALSLLVFTLLEDVSIEGSECLPDLRNLAVYEGYENILMNLTTDTNNVWWRVFPTSEESDDRTIQDYNGNMDSNLTGLFYPNQSGLVILHATTTPNGGPISTAGLYIAQCADNENRTGAKLLVVRAAPECSCNVSSDETIHLACSIDYADVTLHPIYATMTWKFLSEYVFDVDTPQRTMKGYVYESRSTTTAPGNVPPTFTCTVTFNAPTDISYEFIATNPPEFSASCAMEARRLENDSLVCVTTTTTTQPPTAEPSTTISTTDTLTTTTQPSTTEPSTTTSTSTTTTPTSASSTASTTSTSTSTPPPPLPTTTTPGLLICILVDILNIFPGPDCLSYCISKGFSGGTCVPSSSVKEKQCRCF